MADEEKNKIEKSVEYEQQAEIPEKLEKIHTDKLRGRLVVFNPKESEFAKNLKIDKPGDYVQKTK